MAGGPEELPKPVDLNSLQAEDIPPIGNVTVPEPEFPEPPPAENPRRRSWRTPKKRTASKPSPAAKAVGNLPRPRRGQFVKPITQTYTTIGVALMPFDPVCANAFVANAESIAKAWDNAAYNNDAVRRALTEFLKTSIAAELLLAHTPLMMAVVIHHSKRAQDMLSQMGTQFAEVVENNMKAGDMGNGVEEP